MRGWRRFSFLVVLAAAACAPAEVPAAAQPVRPAPAPVVGSADVKGGERVDVEKSRVSRSAVPREPRLTEAEREANRVESEMIFHAAEPELRRCYAGGLKKRASLHGVTATRISLDLVGRADTRDVASGERDLSCYKEDCSSPDRECVLTPFGVLGDTEARSCVDRALDVSASRDFPTRRHAAEMVIHLLFDARGVHLLRAFDRQAAENALAAHREELRACAKASGFADLRGFTATFDKSGRATEIQFVEQGSIVRTAPCAAEAQSALRVASFDGFGERRWDPTASAEIWKQDALPVVWIASGDR